jgi:hypothetical protein
MLRTVAAGLAFALLYGIAIRLYLYLRVRRDTHRWHIPAVALAAGLGGLAFYAAQQIKQPRVPTWLDLVALLIMAVAAGTIPAILETVHVIRARLLRQATFQVPPTALPRPAPQDRP